MRDVAFWLIVGAFAAAFIYEIARIDLNAPLHRHMAEKGPTMTTPPIVLNVVEEWRAVGELADGEPRDYLHAWITIHHSDFHLTGIRVLPPGDDGIRHAAAPELEEWLDAATALNGAGAFQTTQIIVDDQIGDYVIVGTSFA